MLRQGCSRVGRGAKEGRGLRARPGAPRIRGDALDQGDARMTVRKSLVRPLSVAAGALFLAGLFILSPRVEAQSFEKFFPAKDLTTVGVYYYPEHWDPGQWERDFRNMAAMGFEFTHFAEFAWAQLEPEEGQVRLRVARSIAAAGGEIQPEGHPVHADGHAAGLAGPQVPGGPGDRRRRQPDGPRVEAARHLLERLLPAVLLEDDRTARAPVRRRRTSHRVAAGQRAAAVPRLREGRTGTVQELAEGEVRDHRLRSTRPGATPSGAARTPTSRRSTFRSTTNGA